MNKVLPFILLAFLLSQGAWANAYLMTREKFVHLNDTEKDAYIIQVMEFMAELESKYAYSVSQFGENSSEARKYSSILRELQGLLLSEAVAAEEDLARYGQDFADIISTASTADNTKCFYAGWMSRTTVVTLKGTKGNIKKTLCLHPTRLKKDTPEYQAYTKKESCPRPNGKGQEMISCNPAIFGLKQISSGSLFCVPAGLNMSENSAHACMKEALGADSKNKDGKEDRLKHLRSQFETNKDIVNKISQFVVRTCICNNRDKINNEYLDYARPHRTCYGMLKTLSETVSCGEPVIDQNIPILQDIKNFVTKSAMSGKDIDNAYSSFLKEKTSEVEKACKLPEVKSGPQGDVICKAECKVGEDKKMSCSYSVKEGEEDIAHKAVDPTDEKGKAKVTLNDSKKEIECDTTFPKESEKIECEIDLSEVDGKMQAKVLLPKNPGAESIERTWSNDSKDEFVNIDPTQMKSLSVEVKFKEDGLTHEATCETSVNAPNGSSGDDPKLKVTKKIEAIKVELTGEIVPKTEENLEILWFKIGGAKVETKKEAPKPKTDAPLSEDGDKKPEPKPEPKKEVPPEDGKEQKIGTGTKIPVDREVTKFTVCAHLMRGKKQLDKKCEEIPQKVGLPVQTGPLMQNNQQPMMMRPASNTSAQGIQ